MKNKKAQSAIEFLIIVGAMLFFFVSVLGVFQQNLEIKSKEKRNLEIQETALTIQNEIAVASKSIDGYERELRVPTTIANLEYDISINGNLIYLNTTNGRHAMALPIQNVTGQIQKGTNIIRKEDGLVYITQP
jgi:hypothetical protein